MHEQAGKVRHEARNNISGENIPAYPLPHDLRVYNQTGILVRNRSFDILRPRLNLFVQAKWFTTYPEKVSQPDQAFIYRLQFTNIGNDQFHDSLFAPR
jgi:hypothetical protein